MHLLLTKAILSSFPEWTSQSTLLNRARKDGRVFLKLQADWEQTTHSIRQHFWGLGRELLSCMPSQQYLYILLLFFYCLADVHLLRKGENKVLRVGGNSREENLKKNNGFNSKTVYKNAKIPATLKNHIYSIICVQYIF